ncbi:MAG: hypothetical protein CMO81_09465 [Waddliaceae bacterium]|nr:hypothetical protein [Waddliaceae bacterium]
MTGLEDKTVLSNGISFNNQTLNSLKNTDCALCDLPLVSEIVNQSINPLTQLETKQFLHSACFYRRLEKEASSGDEEFEEIVKELKEDIRKKDSDITIDYPEQNCPISQEPLNDAPVTELPSCRHWYHTSELIQSLAVGVPKRGDCAICSESFLNIRKPTANEMEIENALNGGFERREVTMLPFPPTLVVVGLGIILGFAYMQFTCAVDGCEFP